MNPNRHDFKVHDAATGETITMTADRSPDGVTLLGPWGDMRTSLRFYGFAARNLANTLDEPSTHGSVSAKDGVLVVNHRGQWVRLVLVPDMNNGPMLDVSLPEVDSDALVDFIRVGKYED